MRSIGFLPLLLASQADAARLPRSKGVLTRVTGRNNHQGDSIRVRGLNSDRYALDVGLRSMGADSTGMADDVGGSGGMSPPSAPLPGGMSTPSSPILPTPAPIYTFQPQGAPIPSFPLDPTGVPLPPPTVAPIPCPCHPEDPVAPAPIRPSPFAPISPPAKTQGPVSVDPPFNSSGGSSSAPVKFTRPEPTASSAPDPTPPSVPTMVPDTTAPISDGSVSGTMPPNGVVPTPDGSVPGTMPPNGVVPTPDTMPPVKPTSGTMPPVTPSIMAPVMPSTGTTPPVTPSIMAPVMPSAATTPPVTPSIMAPVMPSTATTPPVSPSVTPPVAPTPGATTAPLSAAPIPDNMAPVAPSLSTVAPATPILDTLAPITTVPVSTAPGSLMPFSGTLAPNTASPDASATSQPTISELSLACDALSLGQVFETNNKIDVYYNYELVTNTSAFDVDTVIETFQSIVALTLATFLVQCDSKRRQLRRMMYPLGVDTNDTILPSRSCSKLTNLTSSEGEACFFMLGYVTMYLSNDSSISQEEAEAVIFQLLELGFNDEVRRRLQEGGFLVNPDIGVLDLFFVGGLPADGNSDSVSRPGTESGTGSGGNDVRALGGLGIGFIVAASFGVILVGLFVMKRRRQNQILHDRGIVLEECSTMDSPPKKKGYESYDMASAHSSNDHDVYVQGNFTEKLASASSEDSSIRTEKYLPSSLRKSHDEYFDAATGIEVETMPTFISPDGEVIKAGEPYEVYSTNILTLPDDHRNYDVPNTVDL